MKFQVVALFFILSVLSEKKVFSQETRFIEISAVDTIELKPLKFIYQVSIQNSSQDYNYSEMPVARNMYSDSGLINQPKPKKNNTSAKQITDLLKSNDFRYSFADENSYSINNYNNNNSDSTILITTNTETELKKLYHLLTAIKNINSHIYNIEYESISSYQNASFNRLYLQAKMNAELMAQASGTTLGQLISVDEDKNLLTDAIQEIKDSETRLIGQNILREKDSFNKKVYKKLLFKFELK